MMALWQQLAEPAYFASTVTVFGLLVGSFLNVVIHRLPIMLERRWRAECHEFLELDYEPPAAFDLIRPRSACPACGHSITAVENIPLLSYLWLRGRCRGCAAAISMQYPLVELVAAILALVVALRLGPGLDTLAVIALSWALLALTVIDLKHTLLPDCITLPFLWLGLILNIDASFVDLQSAVIGAAAGYLSLWSVYQAFKLLTGKEGMGYGDFKLLAVFGAWMGWQSLPLVILLSSLVGALVGLFLILVRGRDRNRPIPFGPYLAAAGWITLLWGDDIMLAYLSRFA